MKKLFFSLVVVPTLFFVTASNLKAQTVPEPMAWWNFDNQSEISAGIVKDKDNTYNGQNFNGVAVSGYSGSAIYFDLSAPSGVPGSGNGDGFTVAGLPSLSQLTITLRMKTDNSTNATQSVIIAQSISPAYGEFNIQYKNGVLGVGVTQNGSAQAVLNLDQSYHYYAVSYDGRNIYIYVDGQVKAFSTAAGTGKVTADKWSFVSNGWINGPNNIVNNITIDDLKIYSRVLNEAEINYEKDNSQLCYADTWSCNEWQVCSANGTQTRSCTKTFECPLVDIPSPAVSQSCTPPALSCEADTWSCANWSTCSLGGTQTRTCSKTSNCEGGVSIPATFQSCVYTPPVLACTSNDWSCGSWNSCSSVGQQTRICNKTSNCEGGVSSPSTVQYCTYIPACTEDFWECTDWGQCNANNQKTRTCSKTYDCSAVNTSSPSTVQSCDYKPLCSADKWECANWGACSPQGVQTRDCKKTYDCSSAETASPATSQYCDAPNKPAQQTPTDDLNIANQDAIIKATVKLLCPVSRTMGSQGTGTVIDSSGTILTNKHVVSGTVGCLVGFIDKYNDEPYFGDRQIADIYKLSSSSDIALLKLRNPDNKKITTVDITKGNSNSIGLGTKITTYGYPAKFGTKITYTSGDFSGVDGDYLKTTAIIDSGNSGGGAYLKNGTFIGIPSMVYTGNFNKMGYILSIDKIKSWLNNSPLAYDSGSSNNYSRVSILEDINLDTLDSLNLFIADEDANRAVVKNENDEIKYKQLIESDANAYKVPLSSDQKTAVTNFVTYGISVKTIQIGAGERRALVRDYFETVGRGEVNWSDMENLVNGQKVVSRNFEKERAQVNTVQKMFKKIFGHDPVFSNPTEDLAWNTMMYRIRFPRDLEKEKAGIGKFQAIFKQSPKSPLDWGAVRALGYVKK